MVVFIDKKTCSLGLYIQAKNMSTVSHRDQTKLRCWKIGAIEASGEICIYFILCLWYLPPLYLPTTVPHSRSKFGQVWGLMKKILFQFLRYVFLAWKDISVMLKSKLRRPRASVMIEWQSLQTRRLCCLIYSTCSAAAFCHWWRGSDHYHDCWIDITCKFKTGWLTE